MDKESYVTFSKALGMYKKTGQLSQAVGVMAGLFTENPQDYHLFRSRSHPPPPQKIIIVQFIHKCNTSDYDYECSVMFKK